MVFLALAMIFILIGSIGRWDDSRFLSTRVALPIFCGLLLVLCLGCTALCACASAELHGPAGVSFSAAAEGMRESC